MDCGGPMEEEVATDPCPKEEAADGGVGGGFLAAAAAAAAAATLAGVFGIFGS